MDYEYVQKPCNKTTVSPTGNNLNPLTKHKKFQIIQTKVTFQLAT